MRTPGPLFSPSMAHFHDRVVVPGTERDPLERPPPPPLALSTLHRMPPPPIPSATFFSQRYTDCIVMYQKDTTDSLVAVIVVVFSSDLLSGSGVQ